MIQSIIDEVGWQWGSGPGAFLTVLVLTPLVIRLTHRMNWLAYPKADRWHQRPTALMGGIAIYAAATLALLVFAGDALPWPIWAGATIMFVTGLVDDLKNLKPGAKLVAQIGATGMLLYAGELFGPGWPLWLSVPVTFLWVLGITNALNLLDNMDGLAAGTAAIVAGVLAVFNWLTGGIGTTGVAMAVAGAAAGFLVFNFKPARIFMGDSGSLFLGYVVAALAVVIQGEVSEAGGRGFGVYVVSTAVLAVPIFDTTLVTVMRTLSGRAISQGGRDHSSHRLVFLGLSEAQAVLTLYGVSLLCGAVALLFLMMDIALFYALAILLLIALGVFGIHLANADVYHQSEPGGEFSNNLAGRYAAVLHALLGRNWKALMGISADLLLVIAAFILAFHLRFESGITARHEAFLLDALPVLVTVKLVVFYAAGLYHGIWRHAGTPEIVRIGEATIAASILSFVALGLIHGFAGLARGVFFIDWMIVTLSIAGVRLGFRGLRQYMSSKRLTGKRVFLYGAGDAGLLSLRELRQNPGLGLVPVGFIDDDPLKQGLSAQGLSVVGSFADLPELCRRYRVEEVLITAFRITEARRMEIGAACEEAGIECGVFSCSFTPFSADASFAPSGDGEPFRYQP